jgi:hypothetical protein
LVLLLEAQPEVWVWRHLAIASLSSIGCSDHHDPSSKALSHASLLRGCTCDRCKRKQNWNHRSKAISSAHRLSAYLRHLFCDRAKLGKDYTL